MYTIDDKENAQVVERLIILSEECTEVAIECNTIAQIISKVLRFGIDDKHPVHQITNRAKLSTEIGQLLEMIDQVVALADLDVEAIKQAKLNKRAMVEKFSRQTGPLNLKDLLGHD